MKVTTKLIEQITVIYSADEREKMFKRVEDYKLKYKGPHFKKSGDSVPNTYKYVGTRPAKAGACP